MRAINDGRVAVIGSRGAVGRILVDCLNRQGYEVLRGTRMAAPESDGTRYVDAYHEDSVREFARDCRVVVNCAGPSCLIGDRVAGALPPGVAYVDAFGADLFEGGAAAGRWVINAGCTPGLSGLLVRHLAGRLEECQEVTVCCGGREQGGVAGFADVILSTAGTYGHPSRMLVGGALAPYTASPTQAQDADSFSAEDADLISPFVTEELRSLAVELGIARLTGLLAVPDRDSRHLLLKAMTLSQTTPEAELMELFAQIDQSKSELDAGKTHWFTMQVTARGLIGGDPVRTSITLRSTNSSEITAQVLAVAVARALEPDCPPGLRWGHEILDPRMALSALDRAGTTICDTAPQPAWHGGGPPQRIESGFL